MQNYSKPHKEGLRSKTIDGMYWMTLSSVLNFVFYFLITAILARLLLPSEHGIMQAATVVISFSEIFWQIGVGPAIVQNKNLNEKHIGTAIVSSFILGFITMVVIFFLSPVISLIFKNDDLIVVLRVLSVIFVFHSISVVSESLLQKEMLFKKIAVNRLISLIFGYGMTSVLLSYVGLGYWALVIATLVQALIKSILMNITCKTKRKIMFDFSSFKELISFGGGFTIAKIFNNIALQIDNIVVSRTMGAESLAIYGKAYQLMSVPAHLLGGVLDQVLFPAMSKAQNEKEKLKIAFKVGMNTIAFVTMPISILLWIFAPEVVMIILGPNWISAVGPVKIYAFTLFFRTGYKISDSLCRALGAEYKRAIRQFIYAVMVAMGAYIGHFYGLEYVALGVSIAIIMNFIIMTSLSMKLTSMKWTDLSKTFAGIAIIELILFIISIFTRSIFTSIPKIFEMIFLSIIVTISYIIILYVYYKRFITIEEQKMLSSLGKIALSKFIKKKAIAKVS